ncbi:MAG: M28 family peptidase [Acidobacteriia bacterium]|nr:M28 family peptidase [Terriglobia bacterium]
MKSLFPAICAVWMVAGAAAQTAPTAGEIADRLTANDLKADVSFLASDALEGRGTPSRGLDIAAEYIAAQFRRAGLEPAGDDGYFQTAPFLSVTPNLDGLELTIQIGDKVIQPGHSSIAVVDPVAVDLGKTLAVWVSAAATERLNALTPEQVRGKVLIIDSAASGPGGRGGGRAPATLLARLRPALVLLLLARPGGRVSTSAAQLRDASAAAVPVLLVWDEAVRKALDEAGPAEVAISAKIAAPSSVPVKLRNVVGVLRGSDPALKDTYVLVTAHYDHLGVRGTGEGDHIFNGANDDASGTASVIEIAHTLASFPSHPKRSVVFVALFGEEAGLLGSRYYARHPVFPLAKTVADINLEQVGRTDVDNGSRVGLVNVTGYDFTTLPRALKKAGEEFDIQVLKDERNSDSYFARSDNQAFADAGVPAHTLSVGYMFPDYHQVGDEWNKLDYENMAKVDRTVALAILLLADSTAAPEWNAANPKTERYVKAYQGLELPATSK